MSEGDDTFDPDAFLRSASASAPEQPTGWVAEDEGDEEPKPKRRVYTFDLVLRIHALIERLERNRFITDVHGEIGEPLPIVMLETFEHGLGLTLPESLTSFYRTCDGFEVRWSYLDEDGQVQPGGEIAMWSFATVFGNWLESLWIEDATMAPERVDFMWELRGIDHQPGFGHAPMTALHIAEQEPDYGVFLHTTEHSARMVLDFFDYVDAAIETMGIVGWQSLFLEDGQADPFALLEHERFYEVLDRFAPEANLSRFYRFPEPDES